VNTEVNANESDVVETMPNQPRMAQLIKKNKLTS
jgi:hypothetical protein